MATEKSEKCNRVPNAKAQGLPGSNSKFEADFEKETDCPQKMKVMAA